MPETLTHADFEPLVGDTVTFAGEERTLELMLDAVELLPQPPDDKGRAPFSLTFHDAEQEHVPQQTFAVEHATLGRLDVFAVPIGPGPDGMRYEAIFT